MDSMDAVAMGESMIAFEARDYGPSREVIFFHKWVGGAITVIGVSTLPPE